MSIYIFVGKSKAGNRFHCLKVSRYGVEKTLTFDIEVILLVSGLSMEQLYKLADGKHIVKI